MRRLFIAYKLVEKIDKAFYPKENLMNLNLGDTRRIVFACQKYGLLRNQAAYVLATAYWETARTMKPVREMGGENYLRTKKYYPYVGMGYVQLTWRDNYQKASDKLGVDFVGTPRLLLDPDYAAEILVLGMKEGWFTGKKLSDYITLQKSNFTGARRIVNGTDKATEIAELARNYDADLKSEGYGEDHLSDVGNMVPEPEKPKVSTKEKPVTHTMRFLSWIASGGGAAALPFVDWRVQLFIAASIVGFAIYAIVTMPQIKAKIGKVVDAL